MEANDLMDLDLEEIRVNLKGEVSDTDGNAIDLDEMENIADKMAEKAEEALAAIRKLRDMVTITKR